jgi:hypothetical protein
MKGVTAELSLPKVLSHPRLLEREDAGWVK